jgi:anthranilate/para-aminobenzoate synthase component II
MYDKIIIIDFDDSFTYNIANVLYQVEKNVKVISHIDFFTDSTFQLLQSHSLPIGIILGPGPGHPIDYVSYFEKINYLRKKTNIFFLGICLGHQILGLLDNLEIKDSVEKLHGISVKYENNRISHKVMRYNSLAVFEDGHEVNWREGDRFISYQFHPESVGTKNQLMFFQSLLNFLS